MYFSESREPSLSPTKTDFPVPAFPTSMTGLLLSSSRSMKYRMRMVSVVCTKHAYDKETMLHATCWGMTFHISQITSKKGTQNVKLWINFTAQLFIPALFHQMPLNNRAIPHQINIFYKIFLTDHQGFASILYANNVIVPNNYCITFLVCIFSFWDIEVLKGFYGP